MTTDDLLQILAERGLAVTTDAKGKMCLRGKREAVTPALQAMLELHRAEFQQEIDRSHTRRAVLVRTGVVVAQWQPGDDWGKFLKAAGEHPGEPLALEQYREDVQGRWTWQRFATTAGGGGGCGTLPGTGADSSP